MAANLRPSEVQQFSSGRRAAGVEYNQSKRATGLRNKGIALDSQALNENYQQSLRHMGQTHGLNLRDLYTNQRMGRNALPGPYAGRGLLNSGIYKQALSDFYEGEHTKQDRENTQYQQGVESATTSYNQGNRQVGLEMERSAEQQQVANEAYYLAMADLNEQEAARRADLASDLRGIG